MLDAAALFGRLVGTMIDPLTWVIPIVVAIAFRGMRSDRKAVLSVVIFLGCAILIAAFQGAMQSQIASFLFGASAVVIWSLAIHCFLALKNWTGSESRPR